MVPKREKAFALCSKLSYASPSKEGAHVLIPGTVKMKLFINIIFADVIYLKLSERDPGSRVDTKPNGKRKEGGFETPRHRHRAEGHVRCTLEFT